MKGSRRRLPLRRSGLFVHDGLDFGIGSGDWADTSMIGNDVGVRAHLVLTSTK